MVELNLDPRRDSPGRLVMRLYRIDLWSHQLVAWSIDADEKPLANLMRVSSIVHGVCQNG